MALRDPPAQPGHLCGKGPLLMVKAKDEATQLADRVRRKLPNPRRKQAEHVPVNLNWKPARPLTTTGE